MLKNLFSTMFLIYIYGFQVVEDTMVVTMEQLTEVVLVRTMVAVTTVPATTVEGATGAATTGTRRWGGARQGGGGRGRGRAGTGPIMKSRTPGLPGKLSPNES